jgi:hypothetical protein
MQCSDPGLPGRHTAWRRHATPARVVQMKRSSVFNHVDLAKDVGARHCSERLRARLHHERLDFLSLPGRAF